MRRRKNTNAIDADVGARVRRMRISIGHMAELLGVDELEAVRIERGLRHLSASAMMLLASAWRVPVAGFFRDVGGH